MKKTLLFLCAFLLAPQAHAFQIFNLNVFDQLQGEWGPDFREKRLKATAAYVSNLDPDLVVFQEAKGKLPGDKGGGKDSVDGTELTAKYPHRLYVHEMTGKDGASYGYWMGSKTKPARWIEDGFSFEGGVARRVQAVLFKNALGGQCLGVLSLHLSYQNSEVRVKEAEWLVKWIQGHEKLCKRWVVVGDFNADREDPEMKLLFGKGLHPLFTETKPTVGAFNPIRRIYGENVPSRTIDWALGWNVKGKAEVVLDTAQENDVWVSDHAAVQLKLEKGEKQ